MILLAAWSSYWHSGRNRPRRLQQSQYLAQTDTNTSRAAIAMAQNTQTTPASTGIDALSSNPNKDKKASDPLFGPNIGPCSAGPAWTTTASRKKLITDDLTPEVLSSWVEKSKQPSQPTTTLQALVNLKRPTLRLSPLSSVPEDSQSPVDVRHQHLHGLEFEYDSDAPKCGIYVHVVLSKTHPEAATIPSASNQAQILLFESVTSGGFNKRLTLEEGAILELGRYDHTPESTTSPVLPEDLPKSESTPDVTTNGGGDTATNTTTNRSNRRGRFTHFHFRKRSTNRSVAGPALAVVDVDPHPAQDNAKKDNNNNKEEEEGVRVIIRLAALDEQGTEFSTPNEQTTFLHIVRLGAKPTEPIAEDGEVEDNRPWVVKVVKREATIGPHTFQLHEIYGLTSSTHAPPSSATSTPETAHTYPPQAGGGGGTEEEDPSSECLLCLSSPREVVLIPCRHLVACKECALNMVEFGAGGQITHAAEPTVPPPAVVADNSTTTEVPNGTATTNGAAERAGADGTSPGVGPPPPPVQSPVTAATPATTGGATTRRKRKAKGWFCPVCRQPYTSLLRITTAAPPEKEHERNSIEDIHVPQQLAGTSGDNTNTNNSGVNGANAGQNDSNNETSERSGSGLLGGAFNVRPGFLRGLTGLTSSSRNNNVGGGTASMANGTVGGAGAGVDAGAGAGASVNLPTDVESRAGLGRVGA